MGNVRLHVAAAALILWGAPAFAFQETNAVPAPAGEPAVGAVATDAGKAAPKARIDVPDVPAGGSEKATELRIPGIGKIGVLPKLDFGLELLYGSNDDKAELAEPEFTEKRPEGGDLTIRGTIKHKF